jgi:hypothetical protein
MQGMWEDSVDLFGQMTRAGFRPDNYTFSSLCKVPHPLTATHLPDKYTFTTLCKVSRSPTAIHLGESDIRCLLPVDSIKVCISC